MRVVAAAILGLSVVGGVAPAAGGEAQVWQGEAFITGYASAAAKSTCIGGGIASIGDYYLLVYRPIITGSPNNGVTYDEGLSFFGSRNAIHYSTDNGVSFGAQGHAYVIYFSTHAGSSQQTTPPASVPFSLKISPTPVTLTTKTVTISGYLDDFENAIGCNVTFTAALAERVD